jgi:hypothetical protein
MSSHSNNRCLSEPLNFTQTEKRCAGECPSPSSSTITPTLFPEHDLNCATPGQRWGVPPRRGASSPRSAPLTTPAICYAAKDTPAIISASLPRAAPACTDLVDDLAAPREIVCPVWYTAPPKWTPPCPLALAMVNLYTMGQTIFASRSIRP